MSRPRPTATSTPSSKTPRVCLPRNNDSSISDASSADSSRLSDASNHTILREIGNFKDVVMTRVDENNASNKAEVEKLKNEISELKDTIASLENKFKGAPKQKKRMKLPCDLKRNVRDIIDDLEEGDEWDLTSKFNSKKNRNVTEKIKSLVKDLGMVHSDHLIHRSIYRYFEHKSRALRLGDSMVVSKRRYSRRHRLFTSRSNVELGEDADREMWMKANVTCMSDEETDEETNTKIFKTIPWRSNDFHDLIARIDQTLGVNRHYKGASERQLDLSKVHPDLVASDYL